jgi:hypothetical protein
MASPLSILSRTSDCSRSLILEEKQEMHTQTFRLFVINTEILHNWSVDSVAKRLIAVASLLLLLSGIMPLITAAHGQSGNGQLDYEIRDLQDRIRKLDAVPTEIALILEHQKIEDEHYKSQQEFQGKVLWGFAGTIGAIFLAMFVWTLNQFGIVLGPERQRRR